MIRSISPFSFCFQTCQERKKSIVQCCQLLMDSEWCNPYAICQSSHLTVFAAFVLTRQVCPRILKALDEGFIIEPQSVPIINWINWILASYFHNLWTYQQLLCRSIKSNFELKNYLKINFVQSIILQRRIAKYGI